MTSPPAGKYRNTYNLTWTVETYAPVMETQLWYKSCVSSNTVWNDFHVLKPDQTSLQRPYDNWEAVPPVKPEYFFAGEDVRKTKVKDRRTKKTRTGPMRERSTYVNGYKYYTCRYLHHETPLQPSLRYD